MTSAEFLVREVPRFGRLLFRLGLSGSFGLNESGCREALERVEYVFWTPRMKGLTPALRDALAAYWQVFPAVRAVHFKKADRPATAS